ncbi:DUF960 family protein [Bacillus toyonensis]|uniref:DUF960 family protein n=1 Tax=Bacillus toyonensis TaxID=155322 RepID=UPI0020D22AB9|nr:DUF960 family protein [Bacillus toyonensis]
MIQNIIPLELQQFLWLIIDCRKAAENQLDYLQVFELKSCHEHQHQLVCNIKKYLPLQLEYKFELYSKEVVTYKVWVIDDGKYAIMILPSNY